MTESGGNLITIAGALDLSGQIDLNTNNIIAGGTAAFTTITASVGLIRGANNDSMVLSGGSSTTLGASIILYGESHASRAKDIRFMSSAGLVMEWDDSDSEFTVFAQIVMDDGGLPTDVAGVFIDGSPPSTEDYVDGTIWCVV
jgi:hypothetical protein